MLESHGSLTTKSVRGSTLLTCRLDPAHWHMFSERSHRHWQGSISELADCGSGTPIAFSVTLSLPPVMFPLAPDQGAC